MFKVGRSKQEKIKVLFSLQFQATQVPCSKSKLTISLIPVDVGQPTVRLGKAVVQDGICTWENPVYETVKLSREIKTGIIQDKFYQFIISTGSSKKGFFGEVFVNFADFVEATTPTTIYQPIKSSSAGALLHITIQNLQGADDQRELQMVIEDNGVSISHEGSLQGRDTNSQLVKDMIYDDHEDLYYNTTDALDNEERNNTRNGNTLNALFGHKESLTHQETVSDQSPNKKKPESKASSPADKKHRTRKPLTLDWSSDDDIMNYVEDANKNSLPEREPPKSLVEELKSEVFNLKRQAEVTDIELLSLRRQVVKETKRAQELSGQVVRLKEEREALRKESEKLRVIDESSNTGSEKNSEKGIEHPKETGIENKKSRHRQNEAAEDLVHAKELNRALRSQLRKTQDSNSELILVVRDLEEKLGKKERELDNLTEKMKSDSKPEEIQDEDSDISEYELFREKEAASRCIDSTEVNVLQEQIRDLQGELDEHLEQNRNLQEQIKQFSLDFEIAKKENDDLSSKFNQKQLELIKKERECTQNTRKVEELESQLTRLEKVIQKQAEEFFESSNTIHDLELQVNSLKHELERQEAEFGDELKAMTNANVKLEQRALQAEDNLRRTKQDNASTAQKLREEFRELSEELETKFTENEELTAKSEAEGRELRLQITILEEHLEKVTEELELVQDRCAADIGKLLSQSKEKENELETLLRAHKDGKSKVEDKCEALSNENQALRMEVERLTEENYNFTKKLQEMKTQLDEMRNSFQETKRDKEELETKYANARMEIKQAQEELKVLRSLKEKECAMAGVQSELERHQIQHNELKTRLSDLKGDNENLRKQLTRQKENLQKKDQELANLEKLKDSSSKEVSALKEKVKQLKAVRPSGISPENGSKVEERKLMGKKSQQSAILGKSLQNEASRTTGDSRKGCDSQKSDLLTEVALLKEKNKTMEDELREMQEKYSEVSLKFAEVEGERQQLVMTIRNLRNGQKK